MEKTWWNVWSLVGWSQCWQSFLDDGWSSYAGFIKENKCGVPNIGSGRASKSAFGAPAGYAIAPPWHFDAKQGTARDCTILGRDKSRWKESVAVA
jgi:hypothetical protein